MAALLGSGAVDYLCTTRDGREVSFSDCGSRTGFPVIFFHPKQGNRFVGLTLHKSACEHNLRIITPDRPGFGRSTPLPGRTVLMYPADVADLCDHLEIGQFAAVASSAGAMYALACTQHPATARRLKGAITLIPPWIPPSCNPHWSMLNALGAVSCVIPTAAFAAVLGCMNRRIVSQANEQGAAMVSKGCSAEEREALAANGDGDENFLAFMAELERTRPADLALDAQLALESHGHVGFDYIQDVSHPVRAYIGTRDAMTSASAVQEWANRSSNVEAIIVPQGTHDGLMLTHGPVALRRLAEELHTDAALLA